MSAEQEVYKCDLSLSETSCDLSQGIDCDDLFALMTQYLRFVVDTRRASKLYRQLQKFQNDPRRDPIELQREGLRWLHRVALEGVLPVIDYLVNLYQGSLDKSSHKALRRYLRLRVSLRGDIADLYTLAQHLTDPKTGLRKNYREASNCLRRAIQQGHKESHYLLALLYQKGLGVVCSYDQYLYHLEIAAQAGILEAQIAVARAYGQEGLFARVERAEYWLSQAIEQGDPEALYLLGKLWYHQDGDRYSSRVETLWWRAARAGLPQACYEVGRMLLTDPCQASRRSEAIRYLCQASQTGIYQATQLLYRYHYDESGRYVGVLKGSFGEQTLIEQTLF